MSAWALDCPNERLFFKNCKDYTAEQKCTLMTSVLKNRLGLRGKEFKTCRQHLPPRSAQPLRLLRRNTII